MVAKTGFIFQSLVNFYHHGKETWLLLLLEYCGFYPVCSISLLFLFNALDELLIFCFPVTMSGSFLCTECPYLTQNAYDLTKHGLYHSKTKNYPCPACRKLFTTDSDLKRHERTHVAEKQLECSFQNCSFVTHNDIAWEDSHRHRVQTQLSLSKMF